MSDVSHSSVLVTGAGGFIGSHLVERLVRQGSTVRALVRYNSRGDWGALAWLPAELTGDVEVIAGDIRDYESVASAVRGCDTVCHLAAQIGIPYSYVNPRDFFETNVLGSLNVAQAALNDGVRRLVHCSTSEVYGTAQTIPIDEDHALNPQSPYAASKIGADKLMDSFHQTYQLPVTVLRPFNTYGPRQSARAIIPTIVSQALTGRPLKLGSLTPRRDFTYVADTAEAFWLALESPDAVGRTLQLGTGQEVSVQDLVDLIGELLGRQLVVESEPSRVRPAGSEVARLISTPRLAQELIGWSPATGLREGLRRTIDYLAENQARYRPSEYAI